MQENHWSLCKISTKLLNCLKEFRLCFQKLPFEPVVVIFVLNCTFAFWSWRGMQYFCVTQFGRWMTCDFWILEGDWSWVFLFVCLFVCLFLSKNHLASQWFEDPGLLNLLLVWLNCYGLSPLWGCKMFWVLILNKLVGMFVLMLLANL